MKTTKLDTLVVKVRLPSAVRDTASPQTRGGAVPLAETETPKSWAWFICPDCQQEKPKDKRRTLGRFRVSCADCQESTAEYRRTGVYKKVGPYSKPAWQADYEPEIAEVPAAAVEAYAESVSD